MGTWSLIVEELTGVGNASRIQLGVDVMCSVDRDPAFYGYSWECLQTFLCM